MARDRPKRNADRTPVPVDAPARVTPVFGSYDAVGIESRGTANGPPEAWLNPISPTGGNHCFDIRRGKA